MKAHKRLPCAGLLLAVLFVLLGPATDMAFAAKKLFVGGLSWDTSEQSIVVPLAVRQRYARGDNYFVVSFVRIYDENGNLLARILSEPHRIRPLRPLEDRVIVRVVPQSIPWDRNRGAFTGRAGIIVISQIFDRRGRPVHEGRARGFGFVEIDGAR